MVSVVAVCELSFGVDKRDGKDDWTELVVSMLFACACLFSELHIEAIAHEQ